MAADQSSCGADFAGFAAGFGVGAALAFADGWGAVDFAAGLLSLAGFAAGFAALFFVAFFSVFAVFAVLLMDPRIERKRPMPDARPRASP